jgi:hypothetical protein
MSPSPVPETGYICLCQRTAVFALTLRMQKKTYYQRCVITVALMPWHVLTQRSISIHQILRNKAKLQAYQREYARQKWAPGRRKVSKEERALLEENHLQKRQLLEIEGLGPSPKTPTTLLQCVPPLPPPQFLSVGTYTDIKGLQLRAYSTLPRCGPPTR